MKKAIFLFWIHRFHFPFFKLFHVSNKTSIAARFQPFLKIFLLLIYPTSFYSLFLLFRDEYTVHSSPFLPIHLSEKLPTFAKKITKYNLLLLVQHHLISKVLLILFPNLVSIPHFLNQTAFPKSFWLYDTLFYLEIPILILANPLYSLFLAVLGLEKENKYFFPIQL